MLCIAVLAVNVGNSAIFATLSSVCIVLIYLAYLMVTVPMLVRRLSGRSLGGPDVDTDGRKLFSLGVFAIPVNIAAVGYGALMVVNLSWPRAEIFNPTGSTRSCSGPPPRGARRRDRGRRLLFVPRHRAQRPHPDPRHDRSLK